MRPQTPDERTEQVQPASLTPRWNNVTRIAFRFCFVYFGLFIIYEGAQVFQFLFVPIGGKSSTLLSGEWPMPQIVNWTARHVFQITPTASRTSSDGAVNWVEAFCLLIIAVLATAVWSALDRRRKNYIRLHNWFRLAIRFTLATVMFIYGIDKVIPTQMPFPDPFTLLTPFGNLSLFDVLWSSVGAAPAYEIFAGCAETLAGILLVVPRTTTLGALICLADMTNVFMLNMTYDVPVKLDSFHWLLLSMVLLAPEVPRLTTFFFLDRPAGPPTQPQLFRTRRANRIAFAAQIILGVYLAGTSGYRVWTRWSVYGGGAPKPTLYGIWNVEQLSVDGEVRPPLLTDNSRWRRVAFETARVSVSQGGALMVFQRMDDSLDFYRASINGQDKTIMLSDSDPSRKNWSAHFTYERPAQNRLILDGEMDNHKLQMQLNFFDMKKFPLISNGFHWIQ